MPRLLPIIVMVAVGSISLAQEPRSGQGSATREPPSAAPRGASPSRGDPRLDEADRLLSRGRFEEARALAGVALQESRGSARQDSRESARAESLLGLALYGLQDLEEARVHLGRAVEENPRDAEARLHLAILDLQDGDDARALRLLREAQAIDPRGEEISFRLGEALERTGDLTAAEQAYRDTLRRAPDHGGALYRLARVLDDLGKTTEARIARETHHRLAPLLDQRDTLLEELRLHPEDLDPRLELVRLDLRLGAGGKALRQAREAARLAPDSLPVLDALADAREAEGIHPELRVAIRRGLAERDPGNPRRIRDLARALAREGHGDEAFRTLARAIATGGGDPELWTGMGALSLALGHTDRAEEALREALRLTPGHEEATELLSNLLLDTGRGGEAVELLRARYEENPRDPARGMWVVRAMDRLGREDEAIALARRVAALPAAGPRERTILARLLARRPTSIPEARVILEKVLVEDPLRGEASFALGDIEDHAGERDAAIEHLRGACLLEPLRGDWKTRLAAMLEADGQDAAARLWRARIHDPRARDHR